MPTYTCSEIRINCIPQQELHLSLITFVLETELIKIATQSKPNMFVLKSKKRRKTEQKIQLSLVNLFRNWDSLISPKKLHYSGITFVLESEIKLHMFLSQNFPFTKLNTIRNLYLF